jgi:hypothetical protein
MSTQRTCLVCNEALTGDQVQRSVPLHLTGHGEEGEQADIHEDCVGAWVVGRDAYRKQQKAASVS